MNCVGLETANHYFDPWLWWNENNTLKRVHSNCDASIEQLRRNLPKKTAVTEWVNYHGADWWKNKVGDWRRDDVMSMWSYNLQSTCDHWLSPWFCSQQVDIVHCLQLWSLLFTELNYTVSQKKGPTCKLSVTLSNLNRFSKFLHCWKAYKIRYKSNTILPTSP